jgi:hypothetical protein
MAVLTPFQEIGHFPEKCRNVRHRVVVARLLQRGGEGDVTPGAKDNPVPRQQLGHGWLLDNQVHDPP